MVFEFIIKHDGRKVQKSKVQDLSDFDPIMDGLKEKFGSRKQKGMRHGRGSC